MSDYWDAVARVARGLPGSAEPRPRSMFEIEGPFQATTNVDDAVEHEVDAATLLPPPPPVQAQPAPTPATLETIAASAATRAEITGSPALPAPRPHGSTDERPAPQVRASEPDRPANSHERAAPITPEPMEPATRVEVHHIDTTRTRKVVEIRPPSAEPNDAASTTPAAVPASPVHQVRPLEPTPGVVEPPTIVVAEPVPSMPLSDRPAMPPEQPPLVIEIGRIDIRIESETAPPPAAPKRREAAPAHSLEDFLTRLSGAGP